MLVNCVLNFQIGSRVTINGLVLSQKGPTVDEYINFISKPGTPVDEIGHFCQNVSPSHVYNHGRSLAGQHNGNMI